MVLVGSGSARRTQILTDLDADAELARVGAVRLPFFSASEVEELVARLDRLSLGGSDGFYDTASAGLCFESRQELHGLLCESFARRASDIFVGHLPVMSALLKKWPGDGGEKALHRDFQLVDEPLVRSVCVWVPLIDVDERNGALNVIAGSHLVDSGYRSVPTTPTEPPDPVKELTFDHAVTIPARAGDAVVFDMAVAHGSDVNRSSELRPAVAVAFAPVGADLSLRYRHDDDSVELLRVDDPDVFRRIDWKRRPDLVSLGRLHTRDDVVTAAEFISRSREVAARSGFRLNLPSGTTG